MLATVSNAPPDADLVNPALVYEPKYDGIRALVAIEPAQPSPRVRLWSRLGNEKTSQFPEVVRGLKEFGTRLKRPVLLDGEVVALDARGEPAGFQRLQGRMHLTGSRDIDRHAASQPAAYIVFDVLRDGADDLRPLTLADRRARLERIFGASGSSLVRHGPVEAGDGRRLYRQALREGWEGLLAKRADSVYESGRRSPAWRKLKIQQQREFIVGGWTDPRDTRQYFGALLLGAHESSRAGKRSGIRYVGHVGTGFTESELARLHQLLRERETSERPFIVKPATNERPHWVRPDLVAQVRFTGWTDEGVLRHPVYLGLRDDVDAGTVMLEEPGESNPSSPRSSNSHEPMLEAGSSNSDAPTSNPRSSARGKTSTRKRRPNTKDRAALDALVQRLSELEETKRDGSIELPDGSTLDVTNLAKVFWPTEHLTKGDLLRYYVSVSPWLLPVVADRPLVMKRFPNGVKGKAFYQQRAPDEVPAGVRVEMVEDESEPGGVMPRLVGGSLLTLLYMTQLAAISQDPWFSRVQSPAEPDFVALDLDPMPGVPFRQVLDVARWVRDELAALDVPALPKTSGSSGLHVYIPLPEHTSYEAGQLLCNIVATIVAIKHPKVATVERSVSKRGRTVYVDYLQNIEGKTLACAYSVRASDFAGVSTPLTWDEVDEGIDPGDYTIRTVLARFDQVGDLWAPMLSGPRVDLSSVLDRLSSTLS
jgi:bifunctional non-homologous end joining protein LigD